MGKFSVRLSDETEKELSKIMEENRKNSKNGGIEYAIVNFRVLQNELERAKEELHQSKQAYGQLHGILSGLNQANQNVFAFFREEEKGKKRVANG